MLYICTHINLRQNNVTFNLGSTVPRVVLISQAVHTSEAKYLDICAENLDVTIYHKTELYVRPMQLTG